MGKITALAVLCLIAASACASHAVAPPSATTSGGPSFDLSLKRGISFMARGEYGNAATEFQAAVEAKPDSAQAHNCLGLCYFHQEDYEQAKGQFERAIALDASFASAKNNLAGIFSLKADYARAEELYKKALELSPDLISANYSLGILLSSLGRSEEGTRYLTRGIALDPDYLERRKDLVTTFSSLSFDMKETYFAYAKAYAAAGNVDRTVDFLAKAREAGFSDWPRILRDPEFEKMRDDPRILVFLKIQRP